MFGGGSSLDAAAGELLRLRQRQQGVMDFTVDFLIVARCSRWLLEPLAHTFLHRLADHIRDLLITYCQHHCQVSPPLLAASNRMFLPPQSQPLPPLASPLLQAAAMKPGPKLLQLGSSAFTPREWRRRKRSNLCLYCSGKGHFVLGFPWLRRHNPHIDWETRIIWGGALPVVSPAGKGPTWLERAQPLTLWILTWRGFPQITTTYTRCSARRGPHRCRPTIPTFAQSTFFLGPLHPRESSTPCLNLSEKPWRNIFRSHWPQESSTRYRRLPGLASFW